jgi:hypothetical protein
VRGPGGWAGCPKAVRGDFGSEEKWACGRWPISDAPWTRPQQATAFLENAAPQHRTPRASANDHLRTASSLYTCPAIISAGAWQLAKTTIRSTLWVVGGRWPISDAPWTRPQQAAVPFCPGPFSSPHPPEPLPSHTTQALSE